MKQITGISLIVLSMFTMVALEAQPNQMSGKKKSNGKTNMPSCSNLSSDEQDFANSLTPSNKRIFCSQFNADQRSSAMEMAEMMDEDGNMMSPDQAVAEVAQMNGIAPGQSMPQQPRGCPVK